HGRGMIQHIDLAADANGKVTAVRAKLLADMGAYLQLVTPGIPLLGAFLYAGVYDVPAYSFSCTSVFTTKTPTDAYRGAGRPEATYAIERAIDALAAKVGLDPAEIRHRNYVPPGNAQVVTGTSPHGQGHETSWSMIVADQLGISPDDVDVLHSDTAISPYGMDTYGSRSLAVGGTAVWLATEKVLAKARAIAA